MTVKDGIQNKMGCSGFTLKSNIKLGYLTLMDQETELPDFPYLEQTFTIYDIPELS